MWTSNLIPVLFLFDDRFKAQLAVGVSAHREESRRVVIGILFEALWAFKLFHLL